MAFDSPAYQALTVRLVPREDFQQALALNSMNFHAGRMLGPLVAGLLMAWYGPAMVFLFDGLSYLLLISILFQLDLSAAKRDLSRTPVGRWKALLQGFKYIVETPPLRFKILQLLMAITLLLPLMIVVFRTYVSEKFGLSAEEFGYVFTIPALGSMLGALSFAVVKPKRPILALFVGVPLSAFTMMLVPLAPTALWAAVIMGLSGLAVYLSFASLTVSLHLDVEEEFRGRLGSVIGMGFLSLGPLASFPIGYLADWIGFNNSVYVVSALFLILSVILALTHWKQWEIGASPSADVSVWSGLKPR